MKYSKLIFFCVALIGVQCSEKSDPAPVSKIVLSLSIDAQYPTSASDDWVLLHSTDGRLIEYKPFESGDNFTFETLNQLPGDEVNVTLFRLVPTDEYNNYSAKSYLHVGIGQEWTVKVRPSLPPEVRTKVGEFHVEVTDVQADRAIALTDRSGQFINSTYSSETNTFDAAPLIYANSPDFFLFIMDPLGKPRYKWFRDVADQDSYKLSLNEMNFFDHEVEVKFPSTDNFSYHIIGSENGNDQYYWVSSNLLSGSGLFPKSSFKLGYNNTFQTYSTWLFFQYDDRSIEYNKSGARPAAITLPVNAVFTASDKSITNFTYTRSQPFVKRNSTWVLRDLESSPKLWGHWEVLSPEGSQVFAEWPEELTTKYSDFSVEKAQYSTTTFYTESAPYQAHLDYIFKDTAYPDIASMSVIVK